jgi:hypothetical protein
MGAPGNAFICEKGHLYHWIEEHLYWDAELWAQYEKLQRDGCPCGAGCKVILSHYGEIGDCLCSRGDLNYPREIRKDRVKVRDNSIVDKFGNPIDAYRWIELPVYDLNNIEMLIGRGTFKDKEEVQIQTSLQKISNEINKLSKEGTEFLLERLTKKLKDDSKKEEIKSPIKVEIKEKEVNGT